MSPRSSRFHVACEGIVDECVVRRILDVLGHATDAVVQTRGKVALDGRLREFNRSSGHVDWLVLRDLDHDAPCASELVRRLLPHPAARMRFRVAVRTIESWLIADREALGVALAIPRRSIPDAPDALDDPKRTLVELARKSKRAKVRRDLVPAPGSAARVGPAYTAWALRFVTAPWSPVRARASSESLARCLDRLR